MLAGSEPQLLAVLAAELREYIALRWPTYYPARAKGAAPTVTLTPRHFGFSMIFQVDLAFDDGQVERLMMKIRRQQRGGSFVRNELTDRTLELSRAEYDEHVSAYKFFARRSDGLSVVRPLDFLASHNAFVIEHAAGQDLSKLVKKDSPIATRAIERCGQWWRLFHYELHRAEERPWSAEAIDAMMTTRMDRLRGIGAPLDAIETLSQEIRAAARAVPPARVPVSLVHGDCKLRHVWATADGIQVLDFGNSKTGDSWIDPAALVVELSLFSLWSARLDSGPKVADIRRLLYAYFDGPPPPAFALYVVDGLLKKWHRRLRNWGAGAGVNRLHKSLKRAGLDKPLERLYIDRWFTTQIRAWLMVARGDAPSWLKSLAEKPCP